MTKLTERDYEIFISPQQRTYYTCTNCGKGSQKIYRLKGDIEERANIDITLAWLCPDCFRERIKRKCKEYVNFT